MSKRFFPQQHGDRKKAKLDITISDHNFPLSQNAATNDDLDNWGDDNEDEMLLMASQACEQAYGDNSELPDFSLCMQPGATSTQMFPKPGPSKEFTFKKPTVNSPQLTSTHLKEKCCRISSPLPGMSSKITNGETFKFNDDLIYNDKVYKGQDPDHVYRQLLQLQEENAKLKSENGKLMDKCVTKEGEASILRTQLKSCQMAVDNARLEKIKAQEKVQMEWTEKLSAANGQMHDLRTQLDFKNLEIISVKERCRKLESTKVKLTQVTVPNNDISSSHRQNHMSSTHNSSLTQRRVKMASAGIQTDNKAHFLKLYKSHCLATPNLTSLLPSILEPTSEEPSLLDSNEKLQTDMDQSQRPCRVFSTFHRIPATAKDVRNKEDNMTVAGIHEDLKSIAEGVDVAERFHKILKATCAVLAVVHRQLALTRARATAAFQRDMDQRYMDAANTLVQVPRRSLLAGRLKATCAVLAVVHRQLALTRARATAAFQRDMDQRYMDAANTLVQVPRRSLLAGRALYKEEQGILARRMVATLTFLLDKVVPHTQVKKMSESASDNIFRVLSDVCSLLDATSCATLYNGLLYSTALLLETLSPHMSLLKSLISCRPMPSVCCRILRVLRKMVLLESNEEICGGAGNMRVDLDQGVLLYKKDSCHLHILLKQIEVSLKCIERQNLMQDALTTTQDLIGFHSNYSIRHSGQENKCDCQLALMQVLVYALRICSIMLKELQSSKENQTLTPSLLASCRAGALLLQGRAARDAELCARLGPAEGAALDFTEFMRGCGHSDLRENMLAELAGVFQCATEDTPSSFHRQAWVKSFDSFSLAD